MRWCGRPEDDPRPCGGRACRCPVARTGSQLSGELVEQFLTVCGGPREEMSGFAAEQVLDRAGGHRGEVHAALEGLSRPDQRAGGVCEVHVGRRDTFPCLDHAQQVVRVQDLRGDLPPDGPVDDRVLRSRLPRARCASAERACSSFSVLRRNRQRGTAAPAPGVVDSRTAVPFGSLFCGETARRTVRHVAVARETCAGRLRPRTSGWPTFKHGRLRVGGPRWVNASEGALAFTHVAWFTRLGRGSAQTSCAG
jgi:hypothetical protein